MIQDMQRVVIVAFDDVQLLDVAGPLEVFTGANLAARRRVYSAAIAALGSQARTSSGLTLTTRPLNTIRGPLDTLIVAGGPGSVREPADPALVHHIGRLAATARRPASVCSGALLLASCGVLDGRRATTHWSVGGRLAARHPEVVVDADPIYIEDRGVWTSAGVTAGIDLALAMVADDLGGDLANEIARWLVLPARRCGLQSQFNPRLANTAAAEPEIAELLEWMQSNLRADLSVPALARRAHLSERQFNRRFKQATNRTPAAVVEALRLDAARELLESTELDVASVSRRCGFGRRETFHRAFVKRFGATPTQHRSSFSTRAA
jgi:transcriptional regulator GlxA family with amidase domain